MVRIVSSWYGTGRHVLNDMCLVLGVTLTRRRLSKYRAGWQAPSPDVVAC